jgi:acetyl-CoA carboxylase carboxyl transferase subunit alpha
MRYSVFSVISPEGCSAILWNDPAKVETATKALRITSEDLKELNLIDDVIDEPLIGAHRDKEGAAHALGEYFLTQLKQLRSLSDEQRMQQRYNKLVSVGEFSE